MKTMHLLRLFVAAAFLLLPTVSLAVVSHPASDVSAGNFSGDFRFTNGFLYIGDALGGVSANAQRTYLAAPDGSVKLSAYNDRVEVGAGGLKFADGTSMSTAAAQLWSQSGSKIYYNSGHVSIGTVNSNPAGIDTFGAEKFLTVESTIAGGDNSVLELVGRPNTPTAPVGRILFTSYNGSQYFPAGIIEIAQASAALGESGYMSFYTSSQGALFERMRITAEEGNVGIGETNPDSKLYVQGSSTDNGIRVRAGSGSGKSSFRVESYNGLDILNVLSNGDVLIGSTIDGPSGANTFFSAPFLQVSNPSSGNGGIIISRGDSMGTGPGNNALHGRLGFGELGGSHRTIAEVRGIQSGTTNNNYGGHLAFFVKGDASDSDPFEAMRIASTGNVGIGTTSPGGKLEVNGGATDGLLVRTSSDLPWGILIKNDKHANRLGMFVHNSGQADIRNADGGVLLLNDGSGNVGIGLTNPGQKLSVAGTIESTSGGFKFPDGSVQTAAVGARACPAGFTPANNEYCIETNPRSSASSATAFVTCGDINAHLCTYGELNYACQKGLASNVGAGSYEWVDDLSNSGYLNVVSSGCVSGGGDPGPRAYRCCFAR